MAKDCLPGEPLQVGKTYKVVRASFGVSDGHIGGRDQGRAIVVLQDTETGEHFRIYPTTKPQPGMDGGIYSDEALECDQLD